MIPFELYELVVTVLYVSDKTIHFEVYELVVTVLYNLATSILCVT